MSYEDMNYYSLGYSADTGQVSYLFVNPFRTEETEDNELFRDHTRAVTPILTDRDIDLEATNQIVSDLARGAFVKMELEYKKYAAQNNEDAAVVAFGELYVAPVEDTDDEPLEESE